VDYLPFPKDFLTQLNEALISVYRDDANEQWMKAYNCVSLSLENNGYIKSRINYDILQEKIRQYDKYNNDKAEISAEYSDLQIAMQKMTDTEKKVLQNYDYYYREEGNSLVFGYSTSGKLDTDLYVFYKRSYHNTHLDIEVIEDKVDWEKGLHEDYDEYMERAKKYVESGKDYNLVLSDIKKNIAHIRYGNFDGHYVDFSPRAILGDIAMLLERSK